MAQKTRFYTGINRHSIVNKAEYLGYKGGFIEQLLAALIVRPGFMAMSLISFVVVVTLFLTGYAFFGVVTFLMYLGLRWASITDTENIAFISRASPLLNKYWPSKWKPDIGDMFIGYEDRTGRQIWKSSSDFLYHSYVIGASGSGKTVFLNSVFLINYLCMGSGLWFIDFKGTTELALQYLSTLHRFGRMNDFKLVNFGNPQPQGSVLKNSHSTSAFHQNDPYPSYMFLDPFITPEGGSGGDSKYFTDNAIQHLMALLQALHDMQKSRYFRITPGLIAHYANMDDFLGLYHDERVSQSIKDRYLEPIYKQFNLKYKEKNATQESDPQRMYGIFVGTYLPSLKFFGDNFGQIFESMVSEFDVVNIANNRQVGLTSLPTASKGQSHIKSLAMATLNQLRTTLGENLGSDFHGNRVDVASVSRTSSDVPFLFAADEYFIGLKAEGALGLNAAQGRGAGLALVVASQDIAALDETNKLEHSQILGSTQNKYIMCLKDVRDTLDMVDKLIPEESVIKRAVSKGEWENYTSNDHASIEKVKVEEALNLTDNNLYPQGTMLAIGPGHACKMRCFYYDAEEFLLDQFRLSCCLPSVPPNLTTLEKEIRLLDLSSRVVVAAQEAQEDMTKLLQSKDSHGMRSIAFGLAGEGWMFSFPENAEENRANVSANSDIENGSSELMKDEGQYATYRIGASAKDLEAFELLFEAPTTTETDTHTPEDPDELEEHQNTLDAPAEEKNSDSDQTVALDEFEALDESEGYLDPASPTPESSQKFASNELEQFETPSISSPEEETEQLYDPIQDNDGMESDLAESEDTHTVNNAGSEFDINHSEIHSEKSDFISSTTSGAEEPDSNEFQEKLREHSVATEAAMSLLSSKTDLFKDVELASSVKKYAEVSAMFSGNISAWESLPPRESDFSQAINELKMDVDEVNVVVDSIA